MQVNLLYKCFYENHVKTYTAKTTQNKYIKPERQTIQGAARACKHGNSLMIQGEEECF